MKNTLQNRIQFFALYIMQKVFKVSKDTEIVQPMDFYFFRERFIERGILQLKSVKKISDNDAAEIGKIITRGMKNLPTDFNITLHGRLFVLNDEKNFYKDATIEVLDFLRINGYATPWNGISVEKMIEFGWIELI